MNTDFIIILVTCSSKKEAVRLVGGLLNKRFIACANVIPAVFSKFRWKGRIDTAVESLIIIKTRRRNFNKIALEVKRLHSYDIPEIIAIPIVAGSRDYLRWLNENVKPLTSMRKEKEQRGRKVER